jgi:hypothetical protein
MNPAQQVARRYYDDEPTIRRLLVDEPMAPSGAGALQLAWQHRAAILQP